MVYQNPLAYLLGLEGVALLRAFAGEYDREFTEARLAEIRQLLDPPSEAGRAVEAQVLDVVGAYRAWAGSYDRPGDAFYEREQSFVWDIVDPLPQGFALDAACGTGRHAEHLAALGHRVIGVDLTPEMLDRARARVPAGEFHEGDLRHLSLPDDHVDLAVGALALIHVPDLGPVFAEFARVLRPGGHLVVSDARGLFGDGIRSPLARAGSGGGPAFLPETHHPTSAYLSAALPAGFRVRRCEEPVQPPAPPSGPDAPRRPASASNVAALNTWCPEAARAAYRGVPDLIVWHFELTAPADGVADRRRRRYPGRMTERITPQQFHDAAGIEDWRVVFEGACAHFRTGSFARGVALVERIGTLADAANHHPDVDLRYPGVTVRLITHDVGGLSDRDVELARQISEAARDLGIAADPSAVQTVQVSIDALVSADVMPFWKALLGYRAMGDEDLVDARGRGPSFWFQRMREPRTQRNRIHVDVSVPHDQGEARVAAAIAAGGHLVTDGHAPQWWVLADAEGNEACVATWQGRG